MHTYNNFTISPRRTSFTFLQHVYGSTERSCANCLPAYDPRDKTDITSGHPHGVYKRQRGTYRPSERRPIVAVAADYYGIRCARLTCLIVCTATSRQLLELSSRREALLMSAAHAVESLMLKTCTVNTEQPTTHSRKHGFLHANKQQLKIMSPWRIRRQIVRTALSTTVVHDHKHTHIIIIL